MEEAGEIKNIDTVPVLEWEPGSGRRPKMNIHQKLAWVQKRLIVGKCRGKGEEKNAKVEYAFRNASDILIRAKPLCHAVEARVEAESEPVMLGVGTPVEIREVRLAKKDAKGNVYDAPTYALLSGPRLVAICRAIFTDCETGETIVRTSFAEQDNWRKGQGEPEKRSGSTDSYGTKYALCHIFAIDDQKDADALSNDGSIGVKADDPF